MAYTHFSHVTCDDCGERHIPGNPTECIEVLKSQRDDASRGLDEVLDDLRRTFDPIIPDSGSRDGNLCRIKDAITALNEEVAHLKYERDYPAGSTEAIA